MLAESTVTSWKARPDWSQPLADHPAGAISLTASGDRDPQTVSVFVICITVGTTC
jgi:hypothetical protein